MKTELDLLADRHLRADPQGVLAELGEGKTGTVVIQASPTMAATIGAQHLLWMLVSLLSRQFKVVNQIILDVPDAALYEGVAPFGQKATLLETLEECVRLVSGPHVLVKRVGAGVVPDVALVMGDGAPLAPRHLRLYADGWRFFVGLNGEAPVAPPQSSLAIGPYLCASYAAGEVFKLMRGMNPGKGEFIRSQFASAWTMSCEESWDGLIDGPDTGEFGVLPHFYFAGAGAVAQAAALCLGASAFKGSCSAIDKDALDLSNDNRYVLSTREDDGAPKVDLMQKYLRSRGFECQAIPLWWQDFAVSNGRHAPNDEVRVLERSYKFPIVLSCVDKNGPRHALQNALPQLLVGGSTYGLSAKASIFDLGTKAACLKCHNPILVRNAIIKERIAALQQLAGEQRAAYANDLGLSERDVELLLGPGGCGKLAESDLDRFAAGSPEMSVGFVSAAAGVLLAAQFLRYLHLGAAVVTQEGPMAVATFARAKIRLMRVGRDNACDCEPTLRKRWQGNWPASYRT